MTNGSADAAPGLIHHKEFSHAEVGRAAREGRRAGHQCEAGPLAIGEDDEGMGGRVVEPADEELALAGRPLTQGREQARLGNGKLGQVIAVDRADPGAIVGGVACVS